MSRYPDLTLIIHTPARFSPLKVNAPLCQIWYNRDVVKAFV